MFNVYETRRRDVNVGELRGKYGVDPVTIHKTKSKWIKGKNEVVHQEVISATLKIEIYLDT